MNKLPAPPDLERFSEELQSHMDLRPLNRAVIPEDLRDLIPWAEFWSIGDEIARSEIMGLFSRKELKAFVDAVWPRRQRIDAWDREALALCPVNDLEACAFMSLLQSLDEAHVTIYPPAASEPKELTSQEMEQLAAEFQKKNEEDRLEFMKGIVGPDGVRRQKS